MYAVVNHDGFVFSQDSTNHLPYISFVLFSKTVTTNIGVRLMQESFDLAEIDEINRAHSDQFALDKGWEGYDLRVPEQDLELFLTHLPGRRMLDGGCGWGWYVHRFLEKNLEYQGIDLSPEMIRLSREANPSASFDIMAMHGLTFPDEHFDGVWCSCSLTYDPKSRPPAILGGMKRVLVQGGVMMIVMPFYEPVDEMWYIGGKPDFWRSHYDLEELEEVLCGAGFTIVSSKLRPHFGSFSILVRK